MQKRTLSNVQRGLATAIVLAAAIACGGGSDDTTAPTSTGGDTLRFSYSSARSSGSFSVHQGQAGNASFSIGSLVVTSVSGGRIAGTFSATYTDPFAGGSGTFSITNGYFNLRLRGT